MALDGAYDHPKIRRLSRALRVAPWGGLGLMEALWSWARKGGARTGRIDPVQWDDIADRLCWHEPSENLRSALVKEGLIDAKKGWDWIHDWHQHADNTTRRYLEMHKQNFANGAPPRVPSGGYVDSDLEKVEQEPEKVEQKCDSADSHARMRPVPVPVPVPEEESSSRRRSEEKEKAALETPVVSEAQKPVVFLPDDDDEKALALNPRKALISMMQKAAKRTPDKTLLRHIETALSQAGATIAEFVSDVRPRILRLRAPPDLGFFLQQARDFGETAEGDSAKNETRELILMAKVLAIQTPKVVIPPTPGCGCTGGMITVNGKAKYCPCSLGMNLQHGKRLTR